MASEVTRRRLLSLGLVGLSGAAAVAVAVPILGDLLSPLIKPTKDVWRDLGPVSHFKVGTTVMVTYEDPSPLPWAGLAAKTSAWVRRSGENDFTAFAINCTHLGCPVNWFPTAEIFLCPCHGGVFNADGQVVGGPPQKPLFQHQLRIRDGHLQMRTQALQIA